MKLLQVSDLLDSARKLAHIKPPKGSYGEWKRFLDECEAAGMVAFEEGGTMHVSEPLGFALLRRWRWLRDSCQAELPYHEAEQAFEAAIERERDAVIASMRAQDRTRAAAIRERDDSKRKRKDFSAGWEPDARNE